MGLFDGGEASTAAVARVLNLPVFLIIDAQSSAESAAAVLKGFETYDPRVRLAGVIFNKIGSSRHRDLIESALLARNTVPVIGYMMREKKFHITERHLGLYMGSENPLDAHALNALAAYTENHLDLDLMLQQAGSVTLNENPADSPVVVPRKKKRIGVSMDEAFCFYYQQNLELFTKAGFQVVPFSPLHDRHLPADLQIIYLCGGYPELFAQDLARNKSMLASIRKAHEDDIPLYAECGGFMYLCRTITDNDGISHDMTGIFPYNTAMNKRLRRLGYRVIRLRESCLLGNKGDVLYGHEFHYSDIVTPLIDDNKNCEIKQLYELDNNSYEGYSRGTAIGSYVHLHFANTPAVFRAILATIDSEDKKSCLL